MSGMVVVPPLLPIVVARVEYSRVLDLLMANIIRGHETVKKTSTDELRGVKPS